MTLRTERPEYGAQWIVYPVYRVGKNLRAQDRRNPSTNFNNEPTRSFHSISFSILAWSAKADPIREESRKERPAVFLRRLRPGQPDSFSNDSVDFYRSSSQPSPSIPVKVVKRGLRFEVINGTRYPRNASSEYNRAIKQDSVDFNRANSTR